MLVSAYFNLKGEKGERYLPFETRFRISKAASLHLYIL